MSVAIAPVDDATWMNNLTVHHLPWQDDEQAHARLKNSIEAGHWLVGEATLASPSFTPALLLQSARNHARYVMSTHIDLPYSSYAPRQPRLRLGFLGCDFYEQATAYLMVGWIEALDRRHVEVWAYDHGPQRPHTAFRQRILQAFDHVVPIACLSDRKAAERIHAEGIEVLLSIKDPASARLGILARRPAPVQIHYLYYPGTTGMPFMDFILADDIVIPPALEPYYSEKVLRISGCYQPNDSQRVLAHDTDKTRWGLPINAVVMANFGQAYKITPGMFNLWCQLLKEDMQRVLWLTVEEPHVQIRLRTEVAARGINPDKIIFASKASTQDHLNRLRAADVMVDTFPYGGHTLTSDALWAGTPVVTLCGQTFASRVAASLLHAVQLDELMTHDAPSYLHVVSRLLSNPALRLHYRKRLDAGRARFELFDSKSYAHRFMQMMRDVAGR